MIDPIFVCTETQSPANSVGGKYALEYGSNKVFLLHQTTPKRERQADGGISIFAIEFKLWISIFSRECVVSYRVAGRSQGEGKSFTQIGKEEGKIEFMHTYAYSRQTDVSPKWKSEQSHKFPSTLNTQNILCCVCRSKLVFVSNLGLVLMLAECTLFGGGFQWWKIIGWSSPTGGTFNENSVLTYFHVNISVKKNWANLYKFVQMWEKCMYKFVNICKNLYKKHPHG